MIESGQRFNEHISSFIAEFVTAGREEIYGLVQIEVIMPENQKKGKLDILNNNKKLTHGNDPE